MLKRHNQILITILFFLDLLLAYISWELAYYSRFYWFDFPEAHYLPPHYQYLKAVPVLLVITAIAFSASGVYKSHRVSQLSSEIPHLLKACLWLFLGILVIAFFYRNYSYSRVQMMYFMGTFITFLILLRGLIPVVLKLLHQRGLHTRNIAIIGMSEMAVNFSKTLKRYKSSGMVLKGYVEMPNTAISLVPHNMKCLGTIESVDQIITDHQIDQVFIALSSDQKKDLPEIYDVLFDQLVDIKVLPDLGPFKKLHTDVEAFEDIPIVTIIQSPMAGWNSVAKRLLDIVGASVALLIFSPVMLFIAMVIKLTSSGPIFYRQERMGLDGVTFETLKFRSMRVDAEQETGAVWAQKDDNRRTRFGSFIRKTSLDELPQLFNILKGEMSMVGPRPERPVFIGDFKNKIPNYMLRHKVKAGLTGWAQINGWRGNTSLEKRIECDLYYIEHWSIWFDFKILFLTIFKGFLDPNAY